MRTAVLTLCCCACAAIAGAQDRTLSQPTGAVRFQPRMTVQTAPPPALYAVRPQPQPSPTRRTHSGSRNAALDTEIICGMTVMRKHGDNDRKIVIQPNTAVRGAIRRIQPDVCTSGK